MIENLIGFLKMNDVKYVENEILSGHTTVKIGGKARILIIPRGKYELEDTLRFLVKEKIKFRTVGRMSNVLPPDEEYYNPLVLTEGAREFNITGNTVTAEAGVSLPRLALALSSAGFSGFEELSGIPGSVGGAVFGNAGAYGRDISDSLVSVRVFNLNTMETAELSASDVNFSYRDTSLKDGKNIILSAKFEMTNSDSYVCRERIDSFRQRRLITQPKEPSLGSVFKRLEFGYASKMIDECGLKGLKVGGASVSYKHAGFIINSGKATSADFKALVDEVTKRVYEMNGVRLVREIEYL